MKEIEVKVIEIDKKEVIDKLKSIGAEKILDDDIFTVKFDFPSKRLEKDDCYLRLRKEGEVAVLTFKKAISKEDVKVADELEVAVESFGDTRKVLEAIGMVEVKSWAKHRISYLVGEVRVDIDSQADIPDFLEIEAGSIEEIYDLVDELGLPEENVKPWSGKDLVEYYGRQ